MRNKIVTLADVDAYKPCKPAQHFLGKEWSGTLLDILNHQTVRDDDKIWIACRLFDKKDVQLFACKCARSVLHIYEQQYPGNMGPRRAIDIAERYINEEATKEELFAAYHAANASANAAHSAAYHAANASAHSAANASANAADAAHSAANASANAANAAHSAAHSAAYHAAKAAHSAAYHAAHHAANAADAANAANAADAAYHAAKASAVEELKKMIEKEDTGVDNIFYKNDKEAIIIFRNRPPVRVYSDVGKAIKLAEWLLGVQLIDENTEVECLTLKKT